MTHRILIVGNQTLVGHDLAEKVRERVRAGATELYFLVPATHPRDYVLSIGPNGAAVGAQGASEEVDAYAVAERRLQAVQEGFRELGVAVGGEVGDEDPFHAVTEVLARREFDEIIVSTLSTGASHWLRIDLPSRVHRKFKLPVTTVTSNVASRP